MLGFLACGFASNVLPPMFYDKVSPYVITSPGREIPELNFLGLVSVQAPAILPTTAILVTEDDNDSNRQHDHS